MNALKTKKGFLALVALVVAFGLFAGVTFVQSQEVKSTDPAAPQAGKDAATCPFAKRAQAAEASGMPASCSELHNQALAEGKMSKEAHAAAAAAMASGDTTAMTMEQCRAMMAKAGHTCTEADMKACLEKCRAAGMPECKMAMAADSSGKKMCAGVDSATCAAMKAKGLCCPKATTTKAEAGDATVQPAVVTEQAGAKKPHQCDIMKGSCAPGTKPADKP